MFSRQLYLDEYTSKHFNSLRKKFRNHNFPSGTYVIVLSKNSGRVEYFDCKSFKQKYYKETEDYPLIIGMAQNADSAKNIVVQIIEECVDKTGNADVKIYLKEKTDKLQKSYFKRYDITVMEQKGEE
ncbi:MAG: hypothetical protein E7284_04090 [Lachnospiraceae bacterium]|nr:hypothetical protein [Lachnospiraceae bacterium]